MLSRTEDVLYADSVAQTESNEKVEEETDKLSSTETPTSMTLSDFMGWKVDHGDTNVKKNNSTGDMESYLNGENDKIAVKNIATPKKFSYLEKLENLSGLRSPTARHYL